MTTICTSDLARLLGFSAVLTLGFALVVCLCVDQTLPHCEILSDGVFGGHCTLHPWVSINLLECRPVSRVKSHHFLKEIFKFSGVDVLAIFGLSVCLPEEVRTTSGNQTIMRVLRVCRSERRSLRQNDKENDGRGEQVDTGTLILLAQVNFGGHIARSAKLRLQQARAISASDRRCKTQICNLENIVTVEKKILRFQVSVSIALRVHEAKSVKQLFEVVASSGL